MVMSSWQSARKILEDNGLLINVHDSGRLNGSVQLIFTGILRVFGVFVVDCSELCLIESVVLIIDI